MGRRQFIKVGALATVGLLGGGAAFLSTGGNQAPLTVSAVLAKLEDLVDKNISHQGVWNPAEIFTHCAQSVEYSMMGYPEHKSDLFKATAGTLAFSAFSAKGAMLHSLEEAIPGAPPISIPNQTVLEALTRLKKAFVDFNQYEGVLAPHFAYGELSKAEYEAAHAMHIYNHFDELKVMS